MSDDASRPVDGIGTTRGKYSGELRAAVQDLLATPGARRALVDWGATALMFKDHSEAALSRLDVAPDEPVGISLILEFSCDQFPERHSVTEVWNAINLMRMRSSLHPFPKSEVAFVTTLDGEVDPCDK